MSAATSTKPRRRPKSAASHQAELRPPRQRRVRREGADSIKALDVFAGFGGMSRAMEAAGIDVIHAANHNPYAIDIHEANHPHAEHLIADLVDSDRPDYRSAADLPYAGYAHFSPSCTSHSRANAQKLYLNGESGLDDPDLLERATVSERSRATMTCVLTYMAKHRPLVVSVENVSEVQSWGKRVEGKSYGDGSTWRWWCREVRKLGYDFRVVYLNAQHFGVPQSRDRLFVGIWRTDLTAPDFEHRPIGHCDTCGDVELVQFRKPVPPSGRMTFGRQYWYVCPSCNVRVDPPATPAYEALDFTDLGPTIRERLESGKIPAASTMARLERAAAMLPSFPALLVPAKSQRGTVRLANQPMATLTTQHETGLLAAAQVVAAGNTFEHPGSNCRIRSVDAPMPVQTTTNTGSLLSTAVLPYRANTLPTGHHRPPPAHADPDLPAGRRNAHRPLGAGEAERRCDGHSSPVGDGSSAAKFEKFLGVKLVEEYRPTPGDCYVILTRPYGEPTPPPAVFIVNTFQRWLEVQEILKE